MEKDISENFCKCLFFVSHDLSRLMTEMAEEEFRFTGMSPTYAFLLMLVIEQPGITPTELSIKLHLKPSTITRFIDKLANYGFMERKSEGKNVLLYSTDRGMEMQSQIKSSWMNLYKKYSDKLGADLSSQITNDINNVNTLLSS